MKSWINVAAATLLLGLAACSDPGADAGSGGPVSWADPTASLSGTKLTIWAAQNSNTVPEQVVATFSRKPVFGRGDEY